MTQQRILTLNDFVVVIVARVPLIIADILLIYITWTKLSSRDTLRDIQQSKRLSLTDIFFRNGLFYFVCRESRRTLKLTILYILLHAQGLYISCTSLRRHTRTFDEPAKTLLIEYYSS